MLIEAYRCITYVIKVRNQTKPVADPDLKLKGGGGGGGGIDLLTLSAIFPSVISSFFTQNKGGPGPPAPSPRSATENEYRGCLVLSIRRGYFGG